MSGPSANRRLATAKLAMSEPRTDAGRALVVAAVSEGFAWQFGGAEAILAIEVEARAAALAELREQVEGLLGRLADKPCDRYRAPGTCLDVDMVTPSFRICETCRARAVLALLPAPVTEETP